MYASELLGALESLRDEHSVDLSKLLVVIGNDASGHAVLGELFAGGDFIRLSPGSHSVEIVSQEDAKRAKRIQELRDDPVRKDFRVIDGGQK